MAGAYFRITFIHDVRFGDSTIHRTFERGNDHSLRIYAFHVDIVFPLRNVSQSFGETNR